MKNITIVKMVNKGRSTVQYFTDEMTFSRRIAMIINIMTNVLIKEDCFFVKYLISKYKELNSG